MTYFPPELPGRDSDQIQRNHFRERDGYRGLLGYLAFALAYGAGPVDVGGIPGL
jgi:hypothetical protein